jgi:outer membrane protein assembly factor BamD (BamD/ComL family)
LVSAQEYDAAAAQDQAVANTEERVRTDATAKIGQAAQSAAPAAASTAGIAVEDPQRWYQRIQELRRQGRTEDAEREWRALQAQYPDFRAKPE